jgi:hypothetical protein
MRRQRVPGVTRGMANEFAANINATGDMAMVGKNPDGGVGSAGASRQSSHSDTMLPRASTSRQSPTNISTQHAGDVREAAQILMGEPPAPSVTSERNGNDTTRTQISSGSTHNRIPLPSSSTRAGRLLSKEVSGSSLEVAPPSAAEEAEAEALADSVLALTSLAGGRRKPRKSVEGNTATDAGQATNANDNEGTTRDPASAANGKDDQQREETGAEV